MKAAYGVVKTAYAVWDTSVVFVKHPSLRGLYLKTHPCVLAVACPLEIEGWECGAKIGEPCKRKKTKEPTSQTHVARRKLYAEKIKDRG